MADSEHGSTLLNHSHIKRVGRRVVREDGLVNTLKPLLTVAVLAGIGYGVYIRLNTGNNGPPPVAAGWNNSPAIQLPDATSMTPWTPDGAGGSAVPASPPGTVVVPGGMEAPPFGGAGAER